MRTIGEAEIRKEWALNWALFDEVLADLGQTSGDVWDPWALAVFLDVPALQIAELIPVARAAGVTEGFDLEEKVRTGVADAMKRLGCRGVEGSERPLPLEFGLTGALLEWDWAEMEAAGEPTWVFFERLRELRLRLPEVTLCERTAYQFLERVPPPRIRDD